MHFSKIVSPRPSNHLLPDCLLEDRCRCLPLKNILLNIQKRFRYFKSVFKIFEIFKIFRVQVRPTKKVLKTLKPYCPGGLCLLQQLPTGNVDHFMGLPIRKCCHLYYGAFSRLVHSHGIGSIDWFLRYIQEDLPNPAKSKNPKNVQFIFLCRFSMPWKTQLSSGCGFIFSDGSNLVHPRFWAQHIL